MLYTHFVCEANSLFKTPFWAQPHSQHLFPNIKLRHDILGEEPINAKFQSFPTSHHRACETILSFLHVRSISNVCAHTQQSSTGACFQSGSLLSGAVMCGNLCWEMLRVLQIRLGGGEVVYERKGSCSEFLLPDRFLIRSSLLFN